MILRDFQNGILNRLKGDAYFTQSSEITLQAELRNETKKIVKDAIANRGIIGVVGLPKFQRLYDNSYYYVCDLEFYENPTLNTGDRTGFDCLSKAFALLFGYVIPIQNLAQEPSNPFSALIMESGGYAGDREGVPIYALRIQAKIAIDVLTTLLANEVGLFLGDQNGNPLLITPTNS